MPALDNIALFLRTARRRLRMEASARYMVVAANVALVGVFVLSLAAAATGPAAFWPTISIAVLLAVTVSVFALLVLRPWRKLRTDTSMAHVVGKSHPAIASDLRSAVELRQSTRGSPALVGAFMETVSERCQEIDLQSIVSLRRLRRALLLLAGSMAAFVLLAMLAPNVVGRGLRLLTHKPTLFEGATISHEPLVGDVQITYRYPSYTGLPARTVSDSSGEVMALQGTTVELHMRALRPARRALLLFGETGEKGQVAARIDRGTVHTKFVVSENTRYRVWLAPLVGRPVREDRGHRVEAASDQPPVVEIKAAADRLELPAPRPIEIGYQATDDYGLGPVELVFRVGDSVEQRVPLTRGQGKRQVQGQTVWDPSKEALVPGVQIAYRIEARDLDAVSGGARGGNVGSSRTLYLVLEKPRESFDESIENQHQILEKLLGVLADRIELRHASESAKPEADKVGLHVMVVQSIHDTEQAQVAQLSHLIVEQKRSGETSKSLLSSLSDITDRLTKHLRTEGNLLQELRFPDGPNALTRPKDMTLPWSRLGKLRGTDPPHIEALEDSVLLMDDLIGRQRLEDLAGLSRQLTDAFERLKELLARYNATKDEALREQLMREINEMRRRIGELASKIEAVKQRNEVSTEWQNMPDLNEAAASAQKVQDMLQKGDSESLEKALAELGDALKSLNDMLEGNADEFAEERFPKESRALNELTQKISDIEGDERQLAGDTNSLSDEMDQAMDRQRREEMEERIKGLEEKLGALNQKLATDAPKRAGSLAAEDLARSQEHGDRAQRLMEGRDLPEVRKELGEATKNLDHLDRMTKPRIQQDGQGSPMSRFGERMQQANEMAQEISSELDEIAEQMQNAASSEQRQRSGQQAGRQGSIGERTRELAEQAQKEGEGMPGFDRANGELREAAGEMRQAQGALERGDARAGLGRERAAIERLGKLRESMASERMGRSPSNREPVRIPGADDSQAPRAWRQELLEAMREKAPEAFREEVRRYYEELVK